MVVKFTILVPYNDQITFQEEADFLPIIDAMFLKSVRLCPTVINAKTLIFYEKALVLTFSVLHSDTSGIYGKITEKILEKDESTLRKVAKALIETQKDFNSEDIKFWRAFLRFKHYLKLLNQIIDYDAKVIEKCFRVMHSIIGKILYAKLTSEDDQEKEFLESFEGCFEEKRPSKAIQPFGYGHHRLNISEDMQSGHAFITMAFPEDVPVAHIGLFINILGKVNVSKPKGRLHTGSEESHIAQNCDHEIKMITKFSIFTS